MVVAVEHRILFNVRQDERLERAEDRGAVPRRQDVVGVVVVVHRQPDLLEVVDALRPPGRLAS
jgi:hypothetical protein